MTVKHSTVTVGTSAVSLTASVAESDNTYGRSLLVTNESAVTVYIGGSDVTTSAYGLALAAGDQIALDVAGSDEPYAVAATSSNTVRCLHSGV